MMDELLLEGDAPRGSSMPCPSCGTSVEGGTVICINCGYNLQSGSALSTQAINRTTGVVAKEAAVASATGAGSLVTSAIGACVGGAVGAGIWAAVSWITNYEIGYLAILVGALAGGGAYVGSFGRPNMLTGAFGAVAGLGAALGGRYIVFSMMYGVALTADETRAELEALFEPVDILFAVLALATGFGVGAGMEWGDDD